MASSRFNKPGRASFGVLFLAAVLAIAPGAKCAAAQQSHTAHPAHAADTFAPLDSWKAAVFAGDTAALTAMYISAPGAFAKTPQGQTEDPKEEPAFWSRFHAMGLTAIDIRLLERTSPQAGVTILTLRVYLTFGRAPKATEMLVALGQVWVEQGGDWFVYGSQRGDPVPRPILTLPEPAKPNPNLYPAPTEAQKDLSAALAAAARDHKNVIVVFGGNWCFDCHVLDAAFHSKQIAPIIAANFHVVHINIGGYEYNADLAARYDVPLKKGVPAVAVLDSKGKLLTSQQNAEFKSAVKIGPADITQFLEHWKPGSAD